MAGKLWKDIELEIIRDMRNRAHRLRQAADELEKKADQHERAWHEKHADPEAP